ncbi:hypothetical protein JCM1841_002581 [Sporobolomyces salmonicolor]
MLPIALLSCLATALALAPNAAGALPSPSHLVQLPPLAALSPFDARSAASSRSTLSSLAAPLARPLALLSSSRLALVHRRTRGTEREDELRDERGGEHEEGEEDEEDEEDEEEQDEWWESDEEEARQERELWGELLRAISKEGSVSPLFRELVGDEADDELRDMPHLAEQDALLKAAPSPAMVDSIARSRDPAASPASVDEPPRTLLSAALDDLRSLSLSGSADAPTQPHPHRASR